MTYKTNIEKIDKQKKNQPSKNIKNAIINEISFLFFNNACCV